MSASIAPTITEPINIVENLPRALIISSEAERDGSLPILFTV